MPEVAIDSSNLIDHLQRDSLVAIALLNGPIPLTVFAGMDLARELVLFQTLMLATPEHRRELAKVVARLTKGYPSEGVSSESLQSENARLRFDKNKGIAYDHAIACKKLELCRRIAYAKVAEKVVDVAKSTENLRELYYHLMALHRRLSVACYWRQERKILSLMEVLDRNNVKTENFASLSKEKADIFRQIADPCDQLGKIEMQAFNVETGYRRYVAQASDDPDDPEGQTAVELIKEDNYFLNIFIHSLVAIMTDDTWYFTVNCHLKEGGCTEEDERALK